MRQINRRGFIHGAAGLAAATSAMMAANHARAAKANNKVVLGLIGAGGRGRGLAMGFAKLENVEFKYICDVDPGQAAGRVGEVGKAQGRKPQLVTEMKTLFGDKDVDGVVIATPEHWHALATVWACQAGKDVYVEKNVSLYIGEGRKMIEAARKYKRIVQCGTQNRSAPYAYSARDYLKSGKLGKVVHVKVFNMLPSGKWSRGAKGTQPKGLNWDAWLGPATKYEYDRSRHRGWYYWWDYSGGALSGDASHTMDLARIVLGEPPHPHSVYCAAGNFAHGSKQEIPEMQAITYDFGDFAMTCENARFGPYMKKTPGDVRYGDKFPSWPLNSTRIEIYGTKQLMYVGRHGGGWQAVTAGGKVEAQEFGMFPDKFHQPDFIESIRTRKPPKGDIALGHPSAILVHLGNIAYRVGNRQLLFDAKTERFTNNDDANKFLMPPYRDGYRMPETI